MMGLCVTPVDSSPFMESVGNVQNVQTMTFVVSATMVINIICVTDFIGSTLQEVKGEKVNSSELNCIQLKT